MAAARPLVGHVISHTHWDRAWYLPFEQFRLRLVRLMRKLLALLERDSSYKFWLDGQTVPVEDYLEIHPEDEGRIRRLVSARRLFVGPFYVIPDQFLVTAESLIRNLSIGISQAQRLGRVPLVGALSDVFGCPSQVPQILAGFGIDSAVLSRGLSAAEKKLGWAQRWLAPDGRSEVLLYACAGWGYANLFYWGIDAFDAKRYPTIPTDASEWSEEVALRQLESIVKDYRRSGRLNTRHLYLGNGVDHQEAQPHTPALIRALNRAQRGVRLVHSSYEDLVRGVRGERRPLPTHRGPLKHCELHGTMTSRVYLKQDFTRLASRTEMLAEPLLSLAALYGAGHRFFREPGYPGYTFNAGQNWASFPEYPAAELDHLWRLILRNAPHDDICGCSTDATHLDMENRAKRAGEILDHLVADAMLVLSGRLIEREADSELPRLVLFNPHPFECARRLEARVFLPGLRSARGLSVTDSRGAAVPFAVRRSQAAERPVFNGMSWEKTPERGVEVELSIAPRLEGCSLAAFTIARGGECSSPGGAGATATVRRGAAVVENGFCRVVVRRDGTFDVFDKALGRTFRGLGLLEDVEDAGHSYTHARLRRSEKVLSRGERGSLRILSHDRISTTVEVTLALRLPESLDRRRTARSRRRVRAPVRLELEVYHLAKGGRLTATVENRARDHELYAVFPTGLRAGRFIYDSKFDLDSCAVGEPFARIDSVAMVAQGRTALGLVTDCPTLLMSRRSPRGAVELGVSLVRAVGRVCAEVPETMWPAEGAQCLRPLVRRIEWTTGRLADVRRALLRLRRTVWAPPLVAAVTPRASLRYRDPAFTRRGLPREGFLAVEGEDVHLSSWKRSADGRGVCVRVYSLSSRPQVCRVRAAEPARAAFLADLAERRISRLRGGADGGFEFAIRPREIRTVIIELDERLLKR